MPDNKLAGLSQAEKDAQANTGQDQSSQDRAADGLTNGADAPVTSATDDKPADVITTRTADTDAPAVFEPVKPMVPAATRDTDAPFAPHTLNATPGADPLRAPDVDSQRTGPTAVVERAPAMTRGSAINQIQIMWGELVNKLHDFDHDTAGLPDDLVALVDFVKSRSGAKA